MASPTQKQAAEPKDEKKSEDSSIKGKASQLGKDLAKRPAGAEEHLPAGHVAPAIQGAAVALERQIIKIKVDHDLKDRPTQEDLQRQGIIDDPAHLAPSLQKASRALEKSMAKDTVSRNIKRRSSASELEERGILPNQNLAPRLQASAHDLEKNMAKDNLSRNLRRRSSRQELEDQGILHHQEMAHSLQGTAHDLEKAMHRDAVHRSLRERSSRDDLVREGILGDQKVAPKLQSAAQHLEKNMSKDVIRKHLRDQKHGGGHHEHKHEEKIDYYKLVNISYQGRKASFEVRAAQHAVEISAAIRREFNLTAAQRFVLVDDEGIDVVVDGQLETADYTLEIPH